jgi:hypothetical protein
MRGVALEVRALGSGLTRLHASSSRPSSSDAAAVEEPGSAAVVHLEELCGSAASLKVGGDEGCWGWVCKGKGAVLVLSPGLVTAYREVDGSTLCS